VAIAAETGVGEVDDIDDRESSSSSCWLGRKDMLQLGVCGCVCIFCNVLFSLNKYLFLPSLLVRTNNIINNLISLLLDVYIVSLTSCLLKFRPALFELTRIHQLLRRS